MFIEVTEITVEETTGETIKIPIRLNTRFIGAVMPARDGGNTRLALSKELLGDGVTDVVESYEEVNKRIDEALYGFDATPAVV